MLVKNNICQFFQRRWTIFLTITFVILSVYTFVRLVEKFDNVRLYYNNSDSALFMSVDSTKDGEIKLVTRHPKKITFVYESINGEELTPEDFFVELKEVPKVITKAETVFFNNETFLILHLPKVGLNIKNKTLHYSIQSDKALVKFNKDGSIVNKQGGALIWLQFAISVAYVIALGVFCLLLVKSTKWKRENKFLIFSLVLGLFMIFSRPPCSQYNDLIHFDSAYNMSNMLMGYGDSQVTGNLLKRACDLELLPGYYPDQYYESYWCWFGSFFDYAAHFAKNAFKSPDIHLVDSFAAKVMKPQRAFIFSCLSITVARLLRLNQFALFYVGAVVNFLIGIFLIYFSCKKNKFLKNNIILILSSWPVILLELGSYSYDALLLPVAFALINFSIYFYYAEKKTLKDVLILTFLCVFILPIKAVYFPLAFYFILTYFFANKKVKIPVISAVFVLAVLYLGGYLCSLNPNIAFLQSRGTGQNTHEVAYSIADLIQHPGNTVLIQLNTILELPYDQIGDFFFYNAASGRMAKSFEYLFFFLLIVLFCLKKNDVPEFYLPSIIIAVVVTAFIVVVGMTWTNFNSPVMWGIQPRYFLPVVPLYFIASEKLRTGKIVVGFSDGFNLSLILAFFTVIHFVFRIYPHLY